MSTTGIESTAKPVAAPDDGNEYEDAERNFQPKSLKFWSIVVGMYVSIFLVALDRMIIATAIPSITDEFRSIEDIGWYGSAYMLTAAIFNPLFGRFYQLYSTKWVFIVSIAIFEVGSALCGAAPSSPAFIVGRAIAGIGAAGIFTGGIMILIPLVPLRKRPVFVSFFGMAFGVSSVLGPLIGGSFTDNKNLTWRWCFYINLPIGAFTIVAMLLFFHLGPTPRKPLTATDQFKRFDPVGLILFVPSMVCLMLALQWGGTTYAWSAPKIIGLLVTFAVTLLAFTVWEVLTPETALIPARVVLNRSIAGAMVFMLLLYGCMMIIVYYLAIWFQAAQGQSAMEAGIRTIPLVLSLVVASILAAIFTQRIGYYIPVMLLSPILAAVGAGLLSTLEPGDGSSHWIGYQVLYGLGIGAGMQAPNLAPQTVLRRVDVPVGAALMFFMQMIGGSIFLAVGQNVFSHELIGSLSGIAGLDVEAIVNTGATALRSIVPPGEVNVVIDAYSHALTRTFIPGAALSACMIIGPLVMEWKSIKPKKSDTSSNLEAGSDEEKTVKTKEVGAMEKTVQK